MMAPTSAAHIRLGSTIFGSTNPVATALATAVPPRIAPKLKTAAQMTAATGDSTRVPTMVAIEFAESWKPLMKSNTKAIRTIARMYVTTGREASAGGGVGARARTAGSGVLERDALERVRHVLALVHRLLELVVQLLPLQDPQRVGARAAVAVEQGAHRVVVQRVALLLE